MIENKNYSVEMEVGPERYRKYFDIVRRNDSPIHSAFSDFRILAQGLPTEKYEETNGIVSYVPVGDREDAIKARLADIQDKKEGWLIIKSIYDNINLEEQDENTGKNLLEANKQLVEKIDRLLMPALEQALSNPETPVQVPNEFFELRQQLLDSAFVYENLPAVIAYGEVGRQGMFPEGVVDRRDWFDKGKPVRKEWFDKWGISPE